MSLLQMLALAWGVSGREVQRTLGRGVPGFRRVGRGHYRAGGPITAARLRRVRPLDPRLPVAVWLSGERTLQSAARLCEERIVDGLAKARPHMDEARVVLLALETRMAVDYKAVRRDHYLSRAETAVAFGEYRHRIKAELLEAEAEPSFVEVRNSVRRLMNRGAHFATPNPRRGEEEEIVVVGEKKRTRRRHLRDDSAEEMGISLRTHFSNYPRRMWDRAKIAADIRIEVKGPVEVMLEAMERLAEQDLDASEDSVAEELGYECAEILFRTFNPEEYEEALARFEGRAIAEVPRKQGRAKDTGQPEHRIAILKDGGGPT
jgi:hypothetical protein